MKRTLPSLVIVPSDPWDFVTKHGTGPFRGVLALIKEDRTAGLVELTQAIVIQDIECRWVNIYCRYEGDTIDDILRGKELAANLNFSAREEVADVGWQFASEAFSAIGSVSLARTIGIRLR